MASEGDSDREPVRAQMNGRAANLTVGGAGVGGDVDVRDGEGTSRVDVDGETGSLAFQNEAGETTVEYRGDEGAFLIGGRGEGGHIVLRDAEASIAGELKAEDGELTIYSADGTPALRIAADGTIRTAKPIEEGEG